MLKMRNNRFLMIAAVLAGGLGATALTVSAQPLGRETCGGHLAPPPPPGPCRWVCVRAGKGKAQTRRWVWKKVCASSPPGSYGRAEIKKKNVPTVKPNKPAGPND
jgi:hypothetical protein